MSRFLSVIFLIAVIVLVGVGALGYYRGWFTVTVNKDKIEADKEKVVQKVESLTHPATSKVKTIAE